jgi:predicted nucleotidyltransferase component of viral defense system
LLIDRDKLKDLIPAIAGKQKFRPVIVEKDYYLTVVLNNIESFLSDKIVFKGGTLLNKMYLRLSEDLDFTYYRNGDLAARSQRSKAISPIREKMPAFLKALGLRSDNPEGVGANSSTQYIFEIKYPSLITAREESIKLEISLRQLPLDKPVHQVIKHFYQDPFTGEDLIPTNKVLSLSLTEAVAEKLKTAINRQHAAIRDYYDLWHIAESDFDFFQGKFISLFKEKLGAENYKEDYRSKFGLSPDQVAGLYKQVETDLLPVIRSGDNFNLDTVFSKFDQILSDKRYQ